jgi:very-short-patch-repair endonuclease
MPKSPQPLDPPFATGPFRSAAAQQRGQSRGRLRAKDLTAPFPGIRMSAELPESFETRLAAYKPFMTDDRCFSHVTAAQLYGIPLPRELQSVSGIHLSVPFPAFPPRMKGLTGHRLYTSYRAREFRGFRVIRPEVSWCQLATSLTLDELIVAGDYLVQRKRPLCTVADLAAATNTIGRTRGLTNARYALADVRSGTDSPMESVLRLLIIRSGLSEPVIGHTVRDQRGDFVATPDLSYVAERIALEYEGSIHQSDPQVFAEDIERRELLEDAEWLVIRVIARHVYTTPHELLQRITRALVARKAPTS